MADLGNLFIVIAIAATLLMSVADVGMPEVVVLLALYGALFAAYRSIRRRARLKT